MTRPGNIARNTLFLYIRMFITLCVTLFTSRIVIGALGETDYGIYNVVAGVSTSFVFFSSALSTSTQRFFNFEMERGTPQRVRGIFSMSLVIYGTLALLVLAAGLSLGEWLVSDKLVMPPDRRSDAYIVLIAMLLSLSFMLVASVYESVLVARENMKLLCISRHSRCFRKACHSHSCHIHAAQAGYICHTHGRGPVAAVCNNGALLPSPLSGDTPAMVLGKRTV